MQTNELPIEQMTYEQAFNQLETLVQRLENNQLNLEEAAALYETAQALLKHCARLLEQAELRVRTLQENGSNSLAQAEG